MPLTPEQQRLRRGCITASDAPAIIGLHPYRSPIDVWMWLMYGICSLATSHTRWGDAIETAVRDWYQAETGLLVDIPGTLVAEDEPRHAATPDGIVYDGARAVHGLEIKAHEPWLREHYGDPGSDDVPAHELVQCAWGMRVARLPRWVLAVSFGGPPVLFVIERDLELEHMLRAEVDAWWERHVVGRVPPPPDGSASYDRFLRRTPAEDAEVELASVADLVSDLRDAHRDRHAAELGYNEARQRVQQAMGAATRIRTPEGAITWRPDKHGTRVFRVPRKWSKENGE